MPTATLSPLDTFILMITETDLLTDEQKDLYINELSEGRMHPDLEPMIDMIVAREVELAEQDLRVAQREEALTTELLASATKEADAEAPRILAEYEKGLQQIVMDHTAEARTIEHTLDRDVEGMVREKKDDSEADAIRMMLQQKP